MGGSITEPDTKKDVSLCLDITPSARRCRPPRLGSGSFHPDQHHSPAFVDGRGSDGHIFWHNDRWYDYTGTNLAEMQGWGWQKMQHPERPDRVLAQVKAAWPAGQLYELTYPLRSKEGEYHWFLTRVVPIRDEQGRV